MAYILQGKVLNIEMKLTVRQLRQLVRESVEEMHLGGDGDMDHHRMHLGDDDDDMHHDDMDHHGMHLGDDDDDMDHHRMHHGEHGDDNDYSHDEEMEEEEGQNLSKYRGMGRVSDLSESLKLVIREVIEECGCALEEEAIIEELMEKKMGFKKLTKSLAAKGAKNPKGLAYWIGKKKLGKAEMTKRAVEGKKKASK